MVDVVPPGENYLGKPYSAWAAEWWIWICGIEPERNPIKVQDPQGYTDTGDGPVRFLAGTFGDFSGPINRKCKIPAGKAILIPVVNVISSVAEGDDQHGKGPTTESRLLSVARSHMDKVTAIQAKVDGVNISDLWNYRVESNAFELNLDTRNILRDTHHTNVRPGPSKAVTDGYYVLLRPLPTGEHEIFIRAMGMPPDQDKPYVSEVTYSVYVTPGSAADTETTTTGPTQIT